MNLQEELKALKERIAELEEQEKQEREFPQYGNTYWCINAYGGVSKGIWEGYDIEKDILEIGNGFRTEQEADFAVEKLKVEAELRKFSKPFEIWGDNFVMVFDGAFSEQAIKNMSIINMQGAIYFESEEKVRQAIESIGEERINKYIFEVE